MHEMITSGTLVNRVIPAANAPIHVLDEHAEHIAAQDAG